jgi:hypothetical protein
MGKKITNVPQSTDLITQSIVDMIKSQGAKFFGVTFEKANGEIRTMNCQRRQVAGHGGHNTTSHIDRIVTVVLTEKDAKGNPQFRNINCEKILQLNIAGRKISFR